MAVGSSPPQAINKRTANDPVMTANRFKETIDRSYLLLSLIGHRTFLVRSPPVRFYAFGPLPPGPKPGSPVSMLGLAVDTIVRDVELQESLVILKNYQETHTILTLLRIRTLVAMRISAAFGQP